MPDLPTGTVTFLFTDIESSTRILELLGAAEALREDTGVPLPEADRGAITQAIASAREKLGDEMYATTWARARVLTPDQAVERALGT